MRATRWFWPVVTAGIVGNGLVLRQRVAGLPVLEACDDPPDPAHVVVTATGVEVDPATLRAASRHMAGSGLDALDLVPADLPANRTFELARLVDPRAFRDDPLAAGRGAGTALVLTGELATRVGVAEAAERYALGPLDMLRLTAEVKRYAPRTTDLAVSPWLRAAPGDDAGSRYARLEATYAVGVPMLVGARAIALAVLARGLRRARPGAVVAAAAHSLTPVLVTRGTAVAPRDVPGRAPVRLAASALDLAGTVVLRRRGAAGRAADAGTGPADLAARRAEYDRLLAPGTARFFEPRRPDCPMCGSADLRVQVRMPDMLQGKPGTFTLEACDGCGHVFQNPRLTPEGLDFYYRDFYDGSGEGTSELAFGAGGPSYRGRAEIVDGVAEPRRWLDVGAGHGHFCLAARSYWPKTTFDGLDRGDATLEAERRGWVDRGLSGSFPEVAPELAGRYDVVSMHHYLEHTRDPAAELDAVGTVLEPGGLLLIEVPDASSRLGRRLGQWWVPWLQPQHQHFLTVERMRSLLDERGFTTVTCQRSEPHQPADLLFAVYLAVNRVAPPVDVPWRPPSTPWTRARRTAAFGLAAPAFAVALLLDAVLAPVVSRRSSNAYRLLARAPGDPPPAA